MTELRRILLAALAAGCIAVPARAQSADSTLNVGYTMAFWAIPFGHTDYEGTFTNGSYSAKSHFETSGVVSLFWNSTINATVNGRIADRDIEPAVYDSYAQDHNSKVRRVKVTFGNGTPETFADPVFNNNKYPVTDEEKRGAVDPMSAITQILSGVKADGKNPCGTGAQVFDGHRRYDIVFNYLKDQPEKLSNGQYTGNVHLCQVHYNQIAGYKQKILKEGKELPPMYAEFADVPSADAPGGHYVVAVKLWSSLSWGTVTATLNALKIDGKPPQMTPSVKS
jgi:hypothetical protein